MESKKRVVPKRNTRATNLKVEELISPGSPKPSRKKQKPNGTQDNPALKENSQQQQDQQKEHERGEELEAPTFITPVAPKLSEQELIAGLFLPPAELPPTRTPHQPSSPQLNYYDDVLPAKFKHLEEIFNALLTVYLCLKARKQSCTWSCFKEPVESMCNMNLTITHLAQIQTVLPGALKLEMWQHNTANRYGGQLAVEILSPSSSQSLNHVVSPQLRHTFHEHLLQIVNKHHTDFIAKRKLKVPPHGTWHSKFELESVPDISPAPLPPSLTQIQQENPTTTREKLDTEAVDRYITAKPIPAALTGLSADTIAAAREAEDASEAESEEAVLMRRLPGVVRTLHGLCVSEKKRTPQGMRIEKKCAFQRAQLLAQMVDCSAITLSHQESTQALTKLVELIPKWISTYFTDEGTEKKEWVRLSRDVSLSECLASIPKQP